MENGFLGLKGMGEGKRMVIILALQGTACRSNRLCEYFSFSFLKEKCRRENNKKQNPESKESEWILKLTNLF